MIPRSWAHRTLVASLVVLALTGCAVSVLLARGWWPAIPKDLPALGATAERCATAFGRPFVVTNGAGWDSVKNVTYVKGGWYIFVGFNAAGRAEEFVFSKATLPLLPSAKLNPGEQQALLDRFNEGSTWALLQTAAEESGWKRADNKAFASYINVRRWFVFMDFPCLARKFKSLPGNQDKELLPP